MDIKSFPYNDITEIDKQSLRDLFYLVWGNKDATDIHPKEMNAMSFCAIADNIFIGYAGVITWDICVWDKTFTMCGLSCVCTHPFYRKTGVGSGLVKKATEWITQNDKFDVGLFTCSKENTLFYENIGFWKKSTDLILKESDREEAYKSDIMGLNVFKLLISHKAQLYADYFENGIIILDFPKGKFI